MRWLAIAVALLTLVFAGAGCGGGSSEASTDTDVVATDTIGSEDTSTDETATDETSTDETSTDCGDGHERHVQLRLGGLPEPGQGIRRVVGGHRRGERRKGRLRRYRQVLPVRRRGAGGDPSDVQTIAAAYGTFADKLKDIGYTPGEVPAADQIQQLQDASKSVSDARRAGGGRSTDCLDEHAENPARADLQPRLSSAGGTSGAPNTFCT